MPAIDSELTVQLNNSEQLRLLYCPIGQYEMGSAWSESSHQEKPKHKVQIHQAFWMSDTLITRQQFETVLNRQYKGIHESSKHSPASQHSWVDAMEFCVALENDLNSNPVKVERNSNVNYHVSIPTEEQWEYACRANTDTMWFFGDNQVELEKYAWYGTPLAKFVPLPEVKQKLPNPWGFYDLYGLVYEWCLNDSYNYSDQSPPPVTLVDSSVKKFIFKSVRGGSIYSEGWGCRSSARDTLDHWNSQNDLTGFRVVFTET